MGNVTLDMSMYWMALSPDRMTASSGSTNGSTIWRAGASATASPVARWMLMLRFLTNHSKTQGQ